MLAEAESLVPPEELPDALLPLELQAEMARAIAAVPTMAAPSRVVFTREDPFVVEEPRWCSEPATDVRETRWPVGAADMNGR